MSGRLKLAASFSILFLAGSGIACAQQQVIGAPPEALNMKLVGTSDLQALLPKVMPLYQQAKKS